MPDWSKSMVQTFEYYMVDPDSWRDSKVLTNIKKSSISRDSEVETLGSATIDITESVGECYIRTYMSTIQNGVKERIPLGTHLVQTPMSTFDGRIKNVSMDAYTPLLELKENQPPLGYFIPKGANALDYAYRLCREHCRAPVVQPTFQDDDKFKLTTDFVADTNDTWLSFLIDLLASVSYIFALDELGRILFAPNQDTASLQPVWTYDDSNSSILYPDITMDHDLYGIPNVVEVIYFNGTDYYHSRVVNDDPNSPTSTVSRGREIVYRITDPNWIGVPTQKQMDDYAKQTLRNLSSIEYTITYSHGYCPVRIGDCVRLNYTKANLTNIKAKVISQSIRCEAGCPVTEKAVFTTKLWG